MHFPLRSKYNRLTKVARFLQENPSCLLCNILHHYLHQANYSIIEDATMVSYPIKMEITQCVSFSCTSSKVLN